MNNKYFDTKSGRIVTSEEVKAQNPEACTIPANILSTCLFVKDYGELRY